MDKKIRYVIGVLVLSSMLYAQEELYQQIDQLHAADQFNQISGIIDEGLKTYSNDPKVLAQLYWRQSRNFLYLGDDLEDKKAKTEQILKLFEAGEKAADKSIQNDPAVYQAYYWKSSNMGRWGQVKGILDSLFKAGPMRDNLFACIRNNSGHSDSYYVLGMLHEKVPGAPLSFGNIEFSVSYSRKSFDAMQSELSKKLRPEQNFDLYIQLAKQLYKRNWDLNRRKNEQPKIKARFDSAKLLTEKMSFYEGVTVLSEQSDRQEAASLLRAAISYLNGIPNRSKAQNKQLQTAKNLLLEWKM